MPVIFKLKEVLRSKGMTQMDLVRATGIRQPTISAIALGKIVTVPVKVMDKICAALDCQPGDLFEYIPDDEKTPQE